MKDKMFESLRTQISEYGIAVTSAPVLQKCQTPPPCTVRFDSKIHVARVYDLRCKEYRLELVTSNGTVTIEVIIGEYPSVEECVIDIIKMLVELDMHDGKITSNTLDDKVSLIRRTKVTFYKWALFGLTVVLIYISVGK